MNLLLIPIFAILNRWRGSDWPAKHWPFLAKVSCGAILGSRLGGEWWMYPLMFGLYWAGENWGWGGWIGTLINGKPQTIKSLPFIDNIVERIINPKLEPMKYASVCLFLRGILWWSSALSMFWLFGICSLEMFVLMSLLCGIGFPVSILIAVKLKSSDAWALAEVIYGAIHGLVLYLIVG